jgi:hypothetical protein
MKFDERFFGRVEEIKYLRTNKQIKILFMKKLRAA